MPQPVGQEPPVYNFPIPVFNVALRAATKGQFCLAGTRELLEERWREEGRKGRFSDGGREEGNGCPRGD